MSTYPSRRKSALSIAIPASLVDDTPHLREKTLRVGMIARAAAIFTVDEIIVYRDRAKYGRDEAGFIREILAYLAAPQYLRRRAFPLTPNLRYAAILPPLRTPNHPLESRLDQLRDGEYRDALVVGLTKGASLVDVGVEEPVTCRELGLGEGTILTVQLRKYGDRVEAFKADPTSIPHYWIYRVTEAGSLSDLAATRKSSTVIATSRKGEPFSRVENDLSGNLAENDCVVVFGAPARGLFDIASEEGRNLSDICDFIVNMIPNQGTATVRTEEAILATLAILEMSGRCGTVKP